MRPVSVMVRNDGRLTLAELAEVAAVERTLATAAGCLGGFGWVREETALPLYEELRGVPVWLYDLALVRLFPRSARRRALLCLAVKVGKAGSQRRLAWLLDEYGTPEMAVDCLHSGAGQLVGAARRYAAVHGCVLDDTGRDAVARWGEF